MRLPLSFLFPIKKCDTIHMCTECALCLHLGGCKNDNYSNYAEIHNTQWYWGEILNNTYCYSAEFFLGFALCNQVIWFSCVTFLPTWVMLCGKKSCANISFVQVFCSIFLPRKLQNELCPHSFSS